MMCLQSSNVQSYNMGSLHVHRVSKVKTCSNACIDTIVYHIADIKVSISNYIVDLCEVL